jgi:hypothetical protein
MDRFASNQYEVRLVRDIPGLEVHAALLNLYLRKDLFNKNNNKER